MKIRDCDIGQSELDELAKEYRHKLEVIEAIKHFMSRRKILYDSLKGYPGTFIWLSKKYTNEIDSLNGCINKLNKQL